MKIQLSAQINRLWYSLYKSKEGIEYINRYGRFVQLTPKEVIYLIENNVLEFFLDPNYLIGSYHYRLRWRTPTDKKEGFTSCKITSEYSPKTLYVSRKNKLDSHQRQYLKEFN